MLVKIANELMDFDSLVHAWKGNKENEVRILFKNSPSSYILYMDYNDFLWCMKRATMRYGDTAFYDADKELANAKEQEDQINQHRITEEVLSGRFSPPTKVGEDS
jgi:hypothetical protein